MGEEQQKDLESPNAVPTKSGASNCCKVNKCCCTLILITAILCLTVLGFVSWAVYKHKPLIFSGHWVVRRHNEPQGDGYIHETHRLVPSGQWRWQKRVVGLSVLLTPDVVPPEASWERLRTNRADTTLIQAGQRRVSGWFDHVWKTQPSSCGPRAVVNALIELEAPSLKGKMSVEGLTHAMDSIYASLRHEDRNDILSKLVSWFKVWEGALAFGIAKTVNAETPAAEPSSAHKEQLGKWFCRGFRAQVYITEDALEDFPVFKMVCEEWGAKVVKTIPTIRPFERCLEQVVNA